MRASCGCAGTAIVPSILHPPPLLQAGAWHIYNAQGSTNLLGGILHALTPWQVVLQGLLLNAGARLGTSKHPAVCCATGAALA